MSVKLTILSKILDRRRATPLRAYQRRVTGILKFASPGPILNVMDPWPQGGYFAW
ncbi:MAG: hypothetical protein ABI939_07785 [Anaerolineaceae bacterium]